MPRFEDFGIWGVRARAGNQKVHCPKCHERRRNKADKSLSVNFHLGVWKCHNSSCGWAGKLPQSSLSYYSPMQKKQYSTPSSSRVGKQASLTEQAFSYLLNTRKIPLPILERNNVRLIHTAQGKPIIAFNYMREGEVVNIKYRGIEEKTFFVEPGCELIFYKIDDIMEEDSCIICEGEIDALSFEAAGFLNAISVPNGAIPTKDASAAKMEYLDNCGDEIDRIKTFYLATDNDEPGIKTRDELARRLGRDKCLIVNFPEGAKDANDVLVNFGPEKLKECIDKASPYPIEGIHSAMEYERDVFDLFAHGYPEIPPSKFNGIDKYLKFAPGYFTLVTGTPNSGKSAFVTNLSLYLARYANWNFGIYSPENWPTQTHLHQMIEILIGKPMMPGFNGRMQEDEVRKALEFIDKHFWFIRSYDHNYSLDDILERARILVLRQGIDALIIDPWNQIEHQSGSAGSDLSYIGACLTKIRNFSRLHEVHTFLIAHPKKMERDRNDRENNNFEIPTLYSVSGSADFYNICDNGLCVYRKMGRDELGALTTISNDIYIQKVRMRHHGHIGEIQMKYDVSNQRFISPYPTIESLPSSAPLI